MALIIFDTAEPIAVATFDMAVPSAVTKGDNWANEDAIIGNIGANIRRAFATAVIAVFKTVENALPIAVTSGASFPKPVPIAVITVAIGFPALLKIENVAATIDIAAPIAKIATGFASLSAKPKPLKAVARPLPIPLAATLAAVPTDFIT